MQITAPVITIGWIIAVVCLLLCILGVVGVFPFGALEVYGLLAALCVARLL